ncbi:MAG: A/G-specific adenine glycosylase [Pseudomonadota bacterium]
MTDPIAPDKDTSARFADDLLAWYDREARVLPWRVGPHDSGRQAPYRVLVSEVMLQQTTVAVVEKRYPEFLERFPDVRVLARADEADVTAAWAGLGYYRRARALHACAKAVVQDHDAVFPEDEATLRTLPGVGDYTSAAIAAIAFDAPAVVVDGNIERVMARVGLIDAPLPKGKKAIKAAAAARTPQKRGGDYAQALMDLGARICRPKAPNCLLCPIRDHCLAAASGDPERLPVKAPKKDKTTVYGRIFVFQNEDHQVLCVRRPAKGLFAGMLGLPGDGWDGSNTMTSKMTGFKDKGSVSHILTHRRLKIDVFVSAQQPQGIKGEWVSLDEAQASLPTLFVKALERALN